MNKKIKILHVCWEGCMGGLPKFVAELISIQKDDAELDVAVCYAREGGPFYQKVCSLGIPVYTLNLKNGYSISSIRKFYQFLQEKKFDIIHLHNVSTAFFMGALLAGKENRAHLIYVDHGVLVGRWGANLKARLAHRCYTRPMLRWFCNHRFDRCIVNSKFTEASLLKLGVAPAKIVQIYHGINWNDVVVNKPREQMRAELNVDASDFLIGIVSRLSAYKRVERFIEVAQRLQNLSRVKFIIVGGGPEYERLQKMANGYGLNGRLQLLGERKDAYDLMNAFDLFVFTSTGEAWPRTTAEALALGVPVLTFKDGGGAIEIVDHGVNGFIVTDESEAAAVIKEIISDKNKYAHLKMGCGQKLDKFDVDHFAKNIKEQVYTRL